MKYTYASSWKLHVGATSDVVGPMTEAASLSREGQSTCKLCEKIFRYTCWQISATLYKAPAAKGQTGEAMSYFHSTLLSNPGNQKKCNEARLTSFNIHTPSIQCLIT